jgi:hypothetical protein
MQGASWVALLQRVPADQSDNLLVMTNNGTGVAVKGILRVEKEYMVVRGRLMGTTEEGGGFFFLPYDQINYVGFQKLIKETVIQSMYEGEPEALAAQPASQEKVDDQAAGQPEETAPAEPGQPMEPLKPASPGKAALLERLRARRAGGENPK